MTKLSQLKIDPEFQNQINPPSFEETHQLEMNILKEERVLNPIILMLLFYTSFYLTPLRRFTQLSGWSRRYRLVSLSFDK